MFILQSSSPHKSLDGYKDYESVLENIEKNRIRCRLLTEAFAVNVRGQL